MTPPRLKSHRHRLGLSVEALASALGLGSGRTVRRWEEGTRDIPAYVGVMFDIWLDPACPDRPPFKPWLGRSKENTNAHS